MFLCNRNTIDASKPNRGPTKWTRFGEEQRNEREMIFDAKHKNRRKRYGACDDVVRVKL